MRKILLAGAAALAVSSLPIAVQAATYVGSDDSAPTSGPFPGSAAAEAGFLADAANYGAVAMLDFENYSLDYTTVYSAPGATLVANAPNYGDPFSGVQNQALDPRYGFNVTSGGSHWLGFPDGSLTFNFDKTSHAFGFYATGVQAINGGTFQVTYDNGASQTFDLALNGNDGGASYFGFTDAQGFSSITISRPGVDAWGIDNVTYGVGSAVPEPATWAMMITGFGLAGSALRRRRSLVAGPRGLTSSGLAAPVEVPPGLPARRLRTPALAARRLRPGGSSRNIARPA
ncbi:MAG: PEP-CTERM sorting domain-containing protein [Phenylobacterium sp.]|nr:PEP-CTERM sorting domain-containing protein [Phenylobacterium sp.]